MGKKKDAGVEEPSPKADADKKEEDEEEDSPAVKAMKAIDIKFCVIETEYEHEVELLRKKFFDERQAPLLEERSKILGDTSNCPAEDQKTGTPGCKGFWLQALQNADMFAEALEEWDEPVLEYLQDIKKCFIDEQFPQKGFRLDFLFKENPFFTNTSLSVEFYTDYKAEGHKPWEEDDCIEMKATEIDWKPGQNVTVEIIQKKKTGGGKKKAKQQGKAKEEPRESFFRLLFRSMKVGDGLPDDIKQSMGAMDGEGPEGEEEEQAMKMWLEQVHGVGHCIAEEIIPYAVRYYTGEAGDRDSDDDEESEEEDDDDDDDDDDSDDEPPPAKSGAKKKPPKKAADNAGGAEGQKQEECKQQ